MSAIEIVNAKLECMKLAFSKSSTFEDAIKNYTSLVVLLDLPCDNTSSITKQAIN
jgi:hypothetical protein